MPWVREKSETVWLVSDQSHTRTHTAWSVTLGTVRAYLRSGVHFDLIDRVLEQSDERIVTIKHVSAAEEYLQDHFPSFPVLPGVLMLEAMVQAGRRLVAGRGGDARVVLGKVRALKYGRFVKPGSSLRVEVTLAKPLEGGAFDLKGEARLLDPSAPADGEPPVAASGRFVLRPLRAAPAIGAAAPPIMPA